MNLPSFKYPLALVFLLFAMAEIIGCKKQYHAPTNINYNGGTGTGTGTDTSKTADSVATFNAPTGIAVDAQGNIYVADYGNNMIRKITTQGLVTTLAGNGTQGSVNALGNLATFNGPTGVAVDANGNVYVADNNNNQIRKITPAGLVTTLAGSDSTGALNGIGIAATFFAPEGVAVDAAGNVLVTDAGNSLIRKITPAGQVSTLAGNGTPGAVNGDLLAAQFNNPSGIAIAQSGDVYIADLLNNMIRKISGSSVSTLAGSGDIGTADSVGGHASFYFPNSLAVDKSGNVYVTEYITNLIRKIAPDGTTTTFAGSGAEGQADSTGKTATFNGPSGLAIDATGNLYVADTYNNVIRKITPAGVVTTIAGNGKVGAFNGKAQSIGKKRVNSVAQVRVVDRGLLYRALIRRR